MNIPVLANQNILGGWKYINDATGTYFNTEDDVAEAAIRCLEQSAYPRRWFRNHFGPARSTRRLRAFLRTLDPAIPQVEIMRLSRGAGTLTRPPRCQAGDSEVLRANDRPRLA